MKQLLLPAALVFGLLLLTKKSKGSTTEGGTTTGIGIKNPTQEQVKATIQAIRAKYGVEVARNVERIYRLETDNFQSGGFLNTNSAGMKATKTAFPYGWAVRNMTPENAPGVWYAKDNIEGGSAVPWVVFRNFEDAAFYLAAFLDAYGNNGGRWNSTSTGKQTLYRARLMQQPTPYAG